MRSKIAIQNDLDRLNKEIEDIMNMHGDDFHMEYNGATIGEILIEINTEKKQLKEEINKYCEWYKAQENETNESIMSGGWHN